MFNLVFGLQEEEIQGKEVVERKAVKAVILNDDSVFMIKTNKGDYKFPGGGVDKNESIEDALMREIREEAGFSESVIGEQVGTVIERKVDMFDDKSIFQMKSDYYFCGVNGKQDEQDLDDYEKELGFEPVWVSITEAIAQNETLLTENSNDMNPWVLRETSVLKQIVSSHN